MGPLITKVIANIIADMQALMYDLQHLVVLDEIEEASAKFVESTTMHGFKCFLCGKEYSKKVTMFSERLGFNKFGRRMCKKCYGGQSGNYDYPRTHE